MFHFIIILLYKNMKTLFSLGFVLFLSLFLFASSLKIDTHNTAHYHKHSMQHRLKNWFHDSKFSKGK